MIEFFPCSNIADSTLGNQHMNMGVTLEIASKSVKCDNHARFKILLMVLILLTQSFSTSMEAILYGILLLIVYTIVLDKVLLFGTSRVEVKVVSRKSEEIKQAIIHEMDRGVTGLYGRTGFLEEDTEMLMCILSAKELPKTEKLIRSIDSTAFVVVNKANEVYGRGFTEKKQYVK